MPTPVPKTIAQLLTDRPVASLEDGDIIPVREASGTPGTGGILAQNMRPYMLAATPFNTALIADTSYIAQGASVAANTAAIAALTSQATTVGSHGLGSLVSNSTAVTSDLYSGDAAVPMSPNDRLIYQIDHVFQNKLPIADKTVTIGTTSGSTSMTGTGFTSSDSGRVVTATGVPAGATMTFLTSTTATLSVAATATGSPSAVISSPNLFLNLLFKIAGANTFNPTTSLIALPPGGTTAPIYNSTFYMEFLQGATVTTHSQTAYWQIWNGCVSTGSYTAPAMGKLIDARWLVPSLSTDWGTTRQSIEHRINMTAANDNFLMQRYSSVLLLGRAGS